MKRKLKYILCDKSALDVLGKDYVTRLVKKKKLLITSIHIAEYYNGSKYNLLNDDFISNNLLFAPYFSWYMKEILCGRGGRFIHNKMDYTKDMDHEELEERSKNCIDMYDKQYKSFTTKYPDMITKLLISQKDWDKYDLDNIDHIESMRKDILRTFNNQNNRYFNDIDMEFNLNYKKITIDYMKDLQLKCRVKSKCKDKSILYHYDRCSDVMEAEESYTKLLEFMINAWVSSDNQLVDKFINDYIKSNSTRVADFLDKRVLNAFKLKLCIYSCTSSKLVDNSMLKDIEYILYTLYGNIHFVTSDKTIDKIMKVIPTLDTSERRYTFMEQHKDIEKFIIEKERVVDKLIRLPY